MYIYDDICNNLNRMHNLMTVYKWNGRALTLTNKPLIHSLKNVTKCIDLTH